MTASGERLPATGAARLPERIAARVPVLASGDGAARIAVRLPNWTGDVVMATPALRALRAGFPRARISALVREGLAPLLDGLAHCDEVVSLRSWRRGAVALLDEARALRAHRFDLGVCLPDSWSSALLLRAAGVACVVGHARAGRAPLLHVAVAPERAWGPRRRVARELRALHVVEAIGCPPRGTHLELAIGARDASEADALLAAGGLAPRDAFVALAPGASYGDAKRWPPASFARVADGLAEIGVRAVVVGAPEEAELARAVARAASCEVVDLVGRAGLGALKAVLARARALVANDAGARHVAVAVGTPAVVLFGPTDLARTDCNLERVTPLATDVPCRPCGRRSCPIDGRCMAGIAPEAVLQAVRSALAGAT